MVGGVKDVIAWRNMWGDVIGKTITQKDRTELFRAPESRTRKNDKDVDFSWTSK